MTFTELLDGIASALGKADIALTADQVRLLARHAHGVLLANESVNLTSIRDAPGVAEKHVLDSLLGLELVGDSPVGSLVDLGSGAGYPGIPLAVVSGRKTTLIEASSKKAAILRGLVEELGLVGQIDVSDSRAEELARSRPEAFAVATARALAGLPSLVELASPLLKTGGRLIAYKGVPEESELGAGDAAASIAGMRRSASVRAVLPDGSQRTFIVYEKTGQPKLTLPRRPGLAQRRPLAT